MRSRAEETRRGMTLLEVGVALVVLSAAMVALVQLISLTVRQRRLDDQRSLALQELANEAERVAVLPWGELTPEKLASWKPSPELLALLPSVTCRAEIHEEAGTPFLRRIELGVGWTNAVGEEVTPVELSLWRHAPEEAP